MGAAVGRRGSTGRAPKGGIQDEKKHTCAEALGGPEGRRPGLGPSFAQLSSEAWNPQSRVILLPPGQGLAQVAPGWPPIPDSSRVREDASASLEFHVDSSKCPGVFLAPR